jgi:hypothetical protein
MGFFATIQTWTCPARDVPKRPDGVAHSLRLFWHDRRRFGSDERSGILAILIRFFRTARLLESFASDCIDRIIDAYRFSGFSLARHGVGLFAVGHIGADLFLDRLILF